MQPNSGGGEAFVGVKFYRAVLCSVTAEYALNYDIAI